MRVPFCHVGMTRPARVGGDGAHVVFWVWSRSLASIWKLYALLCVALAYVLRQGDASHSGRGAERGALDRDQADFPQRLGVEPEDRLSVVALRVVVDADAEPKQPVVRADQQLVGKLSVAQLHPDAEGACSACAVLVSDETPKRRSPYLHQLVEAREFVPHALARAFRAGCDCTALGVGTVVWEDGTADPAGRWTIEHEPRCPFALAGVAIDEL